MITSINKFRITEASETVELVGSKYYIWSELRSMDAR